MLRLIEAYEPLAYEAKPGMRGRTATFHHFVDLFKTMPAGMQARAAMAGLVAWLLLAFLLSSLALSAPGPAPIQSTAGRLETNGEEAHLIFDISAPVEARAMVLAEPDRIVIDLPAVDFLFTPQLALPQRVSRGRRRDHKAQAEQAVTPAGLVSAYRCGSFAPGRSRIVIDLTAPARIVRAATEPADPKNPSDGKSRLVIVLAPTDRASFRIAAQNGRKLEDTAALLANATKVFSEGASLKPESGADRPVIVIDPGHGGVDSGAMAGTLVEKILVRDFAKSLADKLAAGNRYQIVMTREDDVFVPLGERVKIAQNHHADLFISIHADILSETAGVGGATVYTVSDKASDAEAARVADKENQADLAGGLEAREEAPEVSDILFDLTRRETRAYSHVFARTLVDYWKVVGRLNKNPQRSAGFRVLKAPDVPSVLLELGYLSNEGDHAVLASPEWRAKIVGKVAEAIDRFFALRGPSQNRAQNQISDRMKESTGFPQLGTAVDLAHDVR